jgi:general secretion pathway protein C
LALSGKLRAIMIKIGGKFKGASLIVKGVELALLGAIAYVLVRAGLAFIAPESVWKPVLLAPGSKTVTQIQAVGLRDFTFDPFHREINTDQPLNIGEDAPETTLNLKLFGLRASTDVMAGSAVLETPDRVQKNYQIGDEIINGVELKSVSKDYIVLSQNGRLERLTFERSQASFLSNTAPDGTVREKARVPSPDFLPKTLLASISLAPVLNRGRITGFRISPKRAGAEMPIMGLEPGDILTKIGSVDLTKGGSQLDSLISNLKQASSTSVTVIRGGETITVKVRTPR